jgi:hypothetical protein
MNRSGQSWPQGTAQEVPNVSNQWHETRTGEPTIVDVWRAFLFEARHIKRGHMKGTTQITLTTGDYCQLLTVLAELKDKQEAHQ